MAINLLRKQQVLQVLGPEPAIPAGMPGSSGWSAQTAYDYMDTKKDDGATSCANFYLLSNIVFTNYDLVRIVLLCFLRSEVPPLTYTDVFVGHVDVWRHYSGRGRLLERCESHVTGCFTGCCGGGCGKDIWYVSTRQQRMIELHI